MAQAVPGQRVVNRHDPHNIPGTISSILGHIAKVQWDDGTESDIAIGSLYEAGNSSRWPLYCLAALALGLALFAAIAALL